MFKFSIDHATENMMLAPGMIDDNLEKNSVACSASLAKELNSSIALATAKAIARHLKSKGAPMEEIGTKLSELIRALVSAEQVSKYVDANDAFNIAEFIEWEDCEALWRLPMINKEAMNDISGFWQILGSASMCITWIAESHNGNAKKSGSFNDREKELIEKYERARKAYLEAKRDFEEYAEDCAIDQMNRIFIRFGDQMAKIAPEWFSEVSDTLRIQVRSLEERRKKKLAEKDTPMDRADKS